MFQVKYLESIGSMCANGFTEFLRRALKNCMEMQLQYRYTYCGQGKNHDKLNFSLHGSLIAADFVLYASKKFAQAESVVITKLKKYLQSTCDRDPVKSE